MSRLLPLVTLVGCLGTGADEPRHKDGPADPADPPSVYVVDEASEPAPTATLDEVQVALQDALDQVLLVSARPVQAVYDAAMSGRTVTCPYEYVTPDGTYWYDSCSTPEGASYDGYVFALGEEGLVDPYTGLLYDYWYAFGGATVQDEQGHTMEIGGLAYLSLLYGDYGGFPIEAFTTQVQGTFVYDGPEAAGTWLEQPIDPDLVYSVTTYVNSASVWLDGGYGGFREGWAVAFDENVTGDPLLGLPCGEELSGTVGVRAPDGTWYDVVFDGTASLYEPMDPAECDGCGAAWYRGEELGRICVDVQPMLGLAVQPW